MLEFQESNHIDIDPSTTKLIVYTEIECRIEIKRITNVRETKQILTLIRAAYMMIQKGWLYCKVHN
jgi:hypothetical protein